MSNWKHQVTEDLATILDELIQGKIKSFANLDDRLQGAVCLWHERYEALLAERDPIVLWIDGESITDSQLTQAIASVLDDPIDVDAVLKEIGLCTEPIEFKTTAARAFITVAQLQLALRHPENNGSGAQVAYEIAQNLGRAVSSVVPNAEPLIEAGWQKHNDMTREEFDRCAIANRLRQGSSLIQPKAVPIHPKAVPSTEMEPSPMEQKVIDAAVLLQRMAELGGQPILLAANKNMLPCEGLVEDKSPGTLDAEEITGITFAMNCNAIEAQILLNGINRLVAALPTLNPFTSDPGEQIDP